jgi:hypothetical protein
MLFLTEYSIRDGLDPTDFKRVMELFGIRGSEAGEIAHYVKVDGSGGVTVSELDDITKAYEGTLAYAEFMTFKITPILRIDDAVGPLLAQLAANG